jgi:acyl-CoA hydrolase
VVTSRGLIRYVVTEYGVAYLHGKSIRERAQALIEIAHPKFREGLYEYCERTKWLQRPHAKETTTVR